MCRVIDSLRYLPELGEEEEEAFRKPVKGREGEKGSAWKRNPAQRTRQPNSIISFFLHDSERRDYEGGKIPYFPLTNFMVPGVWVTILFGRRKSFEISLQAK